MDTIAPGENPLVSKLAPFTTAEILGPVTTCAEAMLRVTGMTFEALPRGLGVTVIRP
jgi:hypothetical protein